MHSLDIRIDSQTNSSTIFKWAMKEGLDSERHPNLKALVTRNNAPIFFKCFDSYPSIPSYNREVDGETDNDTWPHLMERFHFPTPDTHSANLVTIGEDGNGVFLAFFLDSNLPETALLRPEWSPDRGNTVWTRHP